MLSERHCQENEKTTINWDKLFIETYMIKNCYLKYVQNNDRKKKNCLNTSPKTQIVICICKDVQHCMASGNCKLKYGDTTSYLLEWQKFKTLTISTAGKDVEQLEPSFIVGGDAN